MTSTSILLLNDKNPGILVSYIVEPNTPKEIIEQFDKISASIKFTQ